MTKGNAEQTSGSQTQSWPDPSHGLGRIREAARRDKKQRFTALMHHITPRLLLESYRDLKRSAAAGVDETTWREYQEGLTGRIAELHERVKTDHYRAKPSKRIYIPKEDGRERPVGIAALEDKIVQKAVVRILEQIYEEQFLGLSYGFRPGRGQHNALDAVWVGITRKRINWILDADLQSFFDTLDHEWLERFLQHRIADRRMLRLIRKWLRAGVSEEGAWSPTRVGTPQGAVISPLLANIFLHYVLDLWAHRWRQVKARGEVIIVRYADDFVMGFQHRQDADEFCHALRERLKKFNLKLNERKTRMIEFGRFADRDRRNRGDGKPETFDFLGFTHICARTRKNSKFMVRREPVARRMNRTLMKIKDRLMGNRHKPVKAQGRWIRSVVQGYLNYFAVPGTSFVLGVFRNQVNRLWLRALRRRSHKARCLTWKRMSKLIETWIPQVRIVHPYPNQRLRV